MTGSSEPVRLPLRRVTRLDLLLWFLRRRQRHRVVGASMVPELRDGDEVLVVPGGPGVVGAVVLAVHPTQAGTSILKRVHEVRDGGVWLLGDNPEHSTDSRHYGLVPAGRVLGTVVARF